MLDEEEEEEEEEDPPALRFRPPAFPVLRRLPRELIAAVYVERAVQLLDVGGTLFMIGVSMVLSHFQI